jgi:hypothetical protein
MCCTHHPTHTVQVPEILPAEVLAKMHAPPKADHPVMSPHQLPDYDGFLFGFPTRVRAAPLSAWTFARGSVVSVLAHSVAKAMPVGQRS